MEIDTLILNGGGILCCSYLGSLQYLFETNLVKKDLSSLKEIYCLSGGMIYILPLLLGMSFENATEFFLKLDEKKITPIESLSIYSLFETYGLFKNDYLSHCFKHIMYFLETDPDLTLKQLHDINPIKLIVKIVNISTNQPLMVDYETHPDLKLTILLQMTTCIPFYFESIQYKGDYYADGGLTGRITGDDVPSKNYFSIFNSYPEKPPKNLMEYFINVMYLMVERDTSIKKRELKLIHTKHNPLDFEIGIEGKQYLIQLGYDQIKEKFNKLSDKISSVHPNHKPHQTTQKNSSEIVSHKWKSIVYHYLVSIDHQ
jgi:hypothetical protein